jgi:hypothetical protein
MPRQDGEFLKQLRRRTAQAAISASALRKQGAAGVVGAARTFMEDLDLRRYSKATQASMGNLLDEDTAGLLKSFPKGARNWGAARKALNLFLRDATYNIDLSGEYGLTKVRPYLEVPLDKDVAAELKGEDERAVLPKKWPGIKNLIKPISDDYQTLAREVAEGLGVYPVDLDVFYWRLRVNKKGNGARK